MAAKLILFFITYLTTMAAIAASPQSDLTDAHADWLSYQEIFTPVVAAIIPEGKRQLGQKLFKDPLLSIDQSFSCESCHLKQYGYGLNSKLTRDRFGHHSLLNSPGLAYSSLMLYQNWSGKFPTLEDQMHAVMTSPKAMAMNWPELIQRLKTAPHYPALFKSAGYKQINQQTITDAMVAYETSLTQPSRFDAYLLGDMDQLSPAEKKGLSKFKHFGCVSCHQGIAIGGNLRQKMGVMRDYIPQHEVGLTLHNGFFNITRNAADKHFFRVPSLRNVALTAPYFHDGSAATLEEAIKAMFRYQLGIEPMKDDISDIAHFLQSLNSIEYEQQ